MKKLLLFVLTVVLITSCQKEKQRYFSESPEINAFKASISEYGNGDWKTWHTHFADTAKLYINSLKSISASDLESAQREMLSNFSSYGFQDKGTFAEMVLDSDDETWVNYWANWHGVLKENGKEIDVPVHITAQYVNGKVVEMYDYYDSNPITVALAEIEAVNNMALEDKAILESINKVVEGWNAHDISNLKSLSVEKLVRTTNGNLELKNITDYEGFMKTFVTAFPDFKVLATKLDIKGNKAYISWTVTGTHNGDFMGNAATGKKIKVNGFSIWTLNAAGKFISEDAYFDNQIMFNQLGITPPKS
jgi:steroid delta-isomerase-like uncharacterized protein